MSLTEVQRLRRPGTLVSVHHLSFNEIFVINGLSRPNIYGKPVHSAEGPIGTTSINSNMGVGRDSLGAAPLAVNANEATIALHTLPLRLKSILHGFALNESYRLEEELKIRNSVEHLALQCCPSTLLFVFIPTHSLVLSSEVRQTCDIDLGIHSVFLRSSSAGRLMG